MYVSIFELTTASVPFAVEYRLFFLEARSPGNSLLGAPSKPDFSGSNTTQRYSNPAFIDVDITLFLTQVTPTIHTLLQVLASTAADHLFTPYYLHVTPYTRSSHYCCCCCSPAGQSDLSRALCLCLSCFRVFSSLGQSSTPHERSARAILIPPRQPLIYTTQVSDFRIGPGNASQPD